MQSHKIQHRPVLHAAPCRAAGFTLVETLLAIAILSLAVIAPLSIASNGLAAATTNKDRLIAVTLAREAVEYIREIRDSNRLKKVSWLKGFTNGLTDCTGSDGCIVDVLSSNNDIQKRNPSNTGPLYYDPTTGLYGYPSSLPNYPPADPQPYASKFTRRVDVSTIAVDPTSGIPREIRVVATVQWQTIFATKSVVVVDQLTNW